MLTRTRTPGKIRTSEASYFWTGWCDLMLHFMHPFAENTCWRFR